MLEVTNDDLEIIKNNFIDMIEKFCDDNNVSLSAETLDDHATVQFNIVHNEFKTKFGDIDNSMTSTCYEAEYDCEINSQDNTLAFRYK